MPLRDRVLLVAVLAILLVGLAIILLPTTVTYATGFTDQCGSAVIAAAQHAPEQTSNYDTTRPPAWYCQEAGKARVLTGFVVLVLGILGAVGVYFIARSGSEPEDADGP